VAKPRLFIGSSTERLPVAKALQNLVSGCADAKVWNEADEFALGESTLDGLVKVGQVYDFALLVFGQDDSAMIRGAEFATVRDNVIFELGLLMGSLGRGRAFWLSPQGAKAPRTMTDLSGIIHLEFDEPALDDPAGISKSLLSIRDAIDKQIRLLGPRPADPLVREVQIKRVLCLASSQYSQKRFDMDIEYIHGFFPGGVTHERGVTAEHFQEYFDTKSWDIVHLGIFVDKENQRMLFDTASGDTQESLRIQAVEGMIKDSGASLVIIITCDSLKFGEQLARFTNVIAGHQAIAPSAAIDWAKIFYRALSHGVPLSQAFNKAQDAADPGLILLSRRDVRFLIPSQDDQCAVPAHLV